MTSVERPALSAAKGRASRGVEGGASRVQRSRRRESCHPEGAQRPRDLLSCLTEPATGRDSRSLVAVAPRDDNPGASRSNGRLDARRSTLDPSLRSGQAARRSRRGVALLAALWLVVAISVVGLQFALEAREHRRLAIGAAERGRSRAAAAGALALTRARLEHALRRPAVSGQALNAMRAADPWLDADSLFSAVDTLGDVVVEVRARDLGERLNVNQLGLEELRAFLGAALDDFVASDELAQAILDWRDPDDVPRPGGAERAQYEREGRLVLPADGPFREIEELLFVQGMTPARYAKIAPYLSTRGTGMVNLNSADEPVLRALPGVTEAMIARVLAMRSQGQRVRSVNELIPGGGRPQPGRGGATPGAEVARRLQQRATVDVREVEVTLVARAGPQAVPVRVLAVVQRGGGSTANLSWQTWQ